MSDGPADLGAALDAARTTLARAVADRGPGARHVTFATHSPDGWPEARTVALRAADLDAGRLTIQTDLATEKVAALRALPRAEVHVWHPETCHQLRLRCEAGLRHGAAVGAAWSAMPASARTSYGKAPPAGTAIDAALGYEVTSDPDSFVVIDLRVIRFDFLYLGDVHKRAIFEDRGDWQGHWISP
ncbi:pyridoxamine 5'-phosphate oxidase family protein [Ponticoccus sp. SC2-23]|uniref:pyridoxamine 5'-phosphate oxidase family protein n=1 Tax=Alexandriicola marinus TaxID=2081710 RepID=UPI000FD9C808|nr:pyridoxamine 5'-phosphate oxidase family protein [Alexandriicola marinus]MBM1219919.1 pyridoxamine 5'-phosphate oxidase family protein [Ponticoccus sp. SC6-9]MBM1224605.1 pyridoxamine 5'-phosphate oxidase family protein [Ponticoccus sp. SC6-15]MBM1228118.1 pyridoxamine 5'-phosphate oxidase family protein [Ponticoccus sp. SC6-38]MBM1234244.1 pyridoxamine 5'-phosphate oxidase family protein [Ponticoccus sp. SC6-45]MBM1238620.1 pyridoxamine 5'-phosphate oxidase family protein [Ponticoccus sp. 